MAALSFYGRAAAAPGNTTAPLLLLLNKTGCATPAATLVANFTVSSDLRTTERVMVTTTVLMTVLGAALFALCLVARLSGRHRGHSMATRIFFRASFALFLPFMSYMFSQARGKQGAPARACLILLWMLLVELLRKKVYAMVAPEGDAFARGVGRYSLFDAVDEAARMVWIGYLIYSYVHGPVVKSLFIILWIFSVAKLCKRACCIELAKRSFDLARNASLISGYMAQLVLADQQHLAADSGGRRRDNVVLSTCNYVVMGESQVAREETPYGFRLRDLPSILNRQRLHHNGGSEPEEEEESTNQQLVRVCTVWQLAESDPVFRYHERRRHKLQETCLGMALFKLLRRRHGGGQREAGTRLGAVGPPAGARPSSSSPYCVAVMLVTGNGHMFRVLGSLFRGLVDLSADMVLQYRCFVHQASFLVNMVLSSSDLIITFLLTITLLAVETNEFVQYLLSDWHLASVLCNYARKPALRRQARVRRTITAALWIKVRSNPAIKVHQLTLLKVHQLHPRRVWMLLSRLLKRRLVGLPDAVVMAEAKDAIAEVLKAVLDRSDGGRVQFTNGSRVQFTNGRDALRHNGFEHLGWACDANDAATLILVWHLATALLETRDDRGEHPLPPAGQAAVTLSRYCAYLVAYEPGLLPDDPAWTDIKYRDMRAELASFFRSCCTTTQRRERLMDTAGFQFHHQSSKLMGKGVMLAKELEDAYGGRAAPHVQHERVWGMLLELWAELLVFVARAPSGGHDAHALALAKGREFITHIWAMLTHAGLRTNHHTRDIPISLQLPTIREVPIGAQSW
ncbi:unnamed protein product [Urochloa decumbens]|uniref:DUF4220 domain-containing protein n=1 Tax=Urochloa decumbens TaxID=240449 RepID=A0ABC9B9Y6_9POAL